MAETVEAGKGSTAELEPGTAELKPAEVITLTPAHYAAATYAREVEAWATAAGYVY